MQVPNQFSAGAIVRVCYIYNVKMCAAMLILLGQCARAGPGARGYFVSS